MTSGGANASCRARADDNPFNPEGGKLTTTLLIYDNLNHGGAQRHIVDLAIGIKKSANFFPVVATGGGVFEKELKDAGVTCTGIPGISYNPLKIIRSLFVISRLIRKYNHPIVHSHSRYYNFIIRAAQLFPGAPATFVSTAHNQFPDKHWSGFWPPDTICVSNAVSEYVRSHSGNPGHVIFNGVSEPERIRTGEDVRQELGVGSEEIMFLNAGRLTAQKAQTELLHAFHDYLKHPDAVPAKLIIAGDGPLRKDLEQSIARLGLEKVAILTGVRDDIPDLMGAADLFVLSSLWEGLPVTMIEAAASGLPLIGTDAGGTADIVRDGRNGLLIPAGDRVMLTDCLIELAGNDKLRKQMGDASRKLYLDEFTVKKFTSATCAFYEEIIGQ